MTPRPPGTPRPGPGCEYSPHKRARIVSARESGMKYKDIALREGVKEATCRKIFSRAPKQTSCVTRPRKGRPQLISDRDARRIFRTIFVQPKITAAQLRVSAVPHASKRTIYRFLKKSGIQKWRCKRRPLLTQAIANLRLEWAHTYNNRDDAFWRRVRWSDECSVERGKGGKWAWSYRRRGFVLRHRNSRHY